MSGQYHERSQKEKVEQATYGFSRALKHMVDYVPKVSNQGEILENAITQVGEKLPGPAGVALFVLERNITKDIFHYYIQSLEIEAALDKLNKTQDNWEKVYAKAKKDPADLQPIGEVVDRIEAMAPLTGAKRDIDFFDKLSEMQLPISESDRQEIDKLFEEPQDSEDILMALFIAAAATSNPFHWYQKPGTPRATKEFDQYADNIIDTAKSYVDYYYYRCIAAFEGKLRPEEVFPKGKPLLPAVIGSIFARYLKALPENFALLIAGDFVPGLDIETKRVIVDRYKEKFDTKKVAKTLDDVGYYPYLQALEKVDEKASNLDFLGTIITEYLYEETDERNTQPFSWLTSKKLEVTRKRLGSMAHTIAATEQVKQTYKLDNDLALLPDGGSIAVINIASYSPNTLDIILIAPESQGEQAYVLQIDQAGRVIGLPPQLRDSAKPLLQFLDNTVRNYLYPVRSERRIVSQAPLEQEEKVAHGTKTSTEQPLMTREERRAQRKEAYARRSARVMKRREVYRDAGIIPANGEDAALVQVAKTEETSFSRKFVPTEKYLEQRNALQVQERVQLDQILEKLSTTPGGMKPLNLKRESIDGNMYSTRLGKDKRIVFAQIKGVRGQFAIVRVEPRGAVYDELKKDFDRVERTLH